MAGKYDRKQAQTRYLSGFASDKEEGNANGKLRTQ